EPVEDAARGAGLDCDCVCVSNLTEHLRLADDERVERGGDAEDVSHGGLVGVRVKLAVEEFDGDGARVAQEPAQALGGLGTFRPRRFSQNLHAVARRDDQPLAHDLAVNERAQTLGARLVGEREPLAHVDGCRLVVESDGNDCHYFEAYPNTWKPPSTTAPTKVQRTSENPATPSQAAFRPRHWTR